MLCTPNFCAALPPKRGRLRGAFVNVFEIKWKKQPFPCWVSEKNGVTLYSYINPEKPDVPLNKNDAFQKVQKRRVQENGERGPIQHDQSPPFFFHLNPL